MPLEQVTVADEGPWVIIEVKGVYLKMPYNVALDVSNALREKAKKAEEFANAEQIIFDSALLIRNNIPLGLSDNPTIKKEAMREAYWNSDLRKYKPFGNIQSREAFGAPSIIQGPPPAKENN